jgi:hypothetical protein
MNSSKKSNVLPITVGDWNVNYIVIDNFFEDSDFRKIQELVSNLKSNDDAVSVFSDNKSLDLGDFDKNKYVKLAEQAITALAPWKVNLYEDNQFHIAITKKNKSYPRHVDIPKKLLSGVIYISPEVNIGTHLHEAKEGGKSSTIKWKPNRAFFFSREEDVSWHSYSAGNEDRAVVIINLICSSPNKALLAELGYLKYFKKKFSEPFKKILPK